MRHAILGAGAIGGLMAVALRTAGEEVIAIVRPETVQRYPRHFSLEQPGGVVSAEVATAGRLEEAADVLWIATKTYQLNSALESVDAQPQTVIPLLNGVDHMEILRRRFGVDRVFAATIAVGADRLEEGCYAQRSSVHLNVGTRAEPLLQGVVAALRQGMGFICGFVENEQTLLWQKLCFIAAFALVTAASGKNKGEVFADPEWKARLYSVVAEAAAVANASGAEIVAARISAAYDPLPDLMRASMLKDLIAGRRLELDAIAGPILRGGAQHAIPTPVTAQLANLVEAQVQQRCAPG